MSGNDAAYRSKVELLSTLIVLIGRAYGIVLIMAFLLTLLLSKLHGAHIHLSQHRHYTLSSSLLISPLRILFISPHFSFTHSLHLSFTHGHLYSHHM